MSERSGFLIFTRFYHYIIRSYQIDYVAEMVSLPECGLLCEKLPGLDAVSFGPDMQDIHTPRERLSIDSTARLYELLRRVIGTMCLCLK